MTKGLLGLALVLPLLLIITTPDAFATSPDCGTDVLKVKEMYIVSENGELWKISIDTSPAETCKIGDIKLGGSGNNILCTDIALDPLTVGLDTLYCVTMESNPNGALYTIDRSNGDATKVGDLERDGDTSKKIGDVNGADFDTAGIFYVVSEGGNFWTLDKTNGHLTFRHNLGMVSSGDLAYDSITASMYWSSRSCPSALDSDCDPEVGDPAGTKNNDGLWQINLSTFDTTFIKSLDLRYVFAMDFTSVGDLCGLTGRFSTDTDDQGLFFATTPSSASGIMIKSTGDCDIFCLVANGGTALNLLLGGFEIAIDKSALLLAGIQTNAVWITSIVLVGVGLVAYNFRKN